MKKLLVVCLVMVGSNAHSTPAWKTANDCKLDLYYAMKSGEASRVKKAFSECGQFWSVAHTYAVEQHDAPVAERLVRWQVEQEKPFFERHPRLAGGVVVGLCTSFFILGNLIEL